MYSIQCGASCYETACTTTLNFKWFEVFTFLSYGFHVAAAVAAVTPVPRAAVTVGWAEWLIRGYPTCNRRVKILAICSMI